MFKKQNTLQPGFNFIEMMVVLVIMGIIISMVGPKVMGLLGKGKKASTENALKVTMGNIKQYKIDTGQYPEKLEDLIKKPEGLQGWDGPYAGSEDSAVAELPKDGWGQDLVYKKNDRGVVPAFVLSSQGDPDKDEPIYAK